MEGPVGLVVVYSEGNGKPWEGWEPKMYMTWTKDHSDCY